MANVEVTIEITPDNELWAALEGKDIGSVRLSVNRKIYRLVEESAGLPWAGYDPEKVREAIRKTSGSWADLDGDQMIEDIYRWRVEGSRPISRPPGD